MSAPSEVILDTKIAAFAAITGNASGVTPMRSAWIRIINVDTVSFVLTTASATDGVWTAEVATDYLGSDAVAVASSNVSPAFPTGVNQSATCVITIPARRYTHLRLTFTPSAGSGAVLANTGVFTSRGVKIERHTRSAGVYFAVPTADNINGTWTMEYSPTHYDRDRSDVGMGVPQIDNLNDPQVWATATDNSDTAYTIPAVTGTGQNQPIRLGVFEFMAIRVKWTPTSGFGRARAILNVKI